MGVPFPFSASAEPRTRKSRVVCIGEVGAITETHALASVPVPPTRAPIDTSRLDESPAPVTVSCRLSACRARFGFRISGFVIWVSGFGFLVSGFGLKAEGFGVLKLGVGG